MALSTYQQQRNLYYITHIDNLPSILQRGILSHERINQLGLNYTAVYDKAIVNNRRDRIVDDKSLWFFANLYLQPRNPMLYRVVLEKTAAKIAVIAVRRDVLDRDGIYVTDGNAASTNTSIFPASERTKVLPSIIKEIKDMEWWNEANSSKRKIMAECLIPEHIPPEYIEAIYVSNYDVAQEVNSMIGSFTLPIIPEPHMFFDPVSKIDLTENLSLVEGDMFFSRLQTLTISVNCVGVMGKGLASRAKYQFPDVYVHYQDLHRKRKLRMGVPSLYARESSYNIELADEPSTITQTNNETWFLLFPTKRHWRERGDIVGIEKGLQWLVANYNLYGIKSIAIPALGCGLGKLQWKDVGPLLCKYLSQLNIPVWIYLPTEMKLSPELLSKEFLLPTSTEVSLRVKDTKKLSEFQ